MLSPKTQCSLANAKEYFEEHLSAGDYYTEAETIAGQWFGNGAELLQLSGTVNRDEFLSLCENLDPNTGERLTQRLKTTRTTTGEDGKTREVANRRVFYDFTFSPPKSVSIAASMGDDLRIVKIHNRAVVTALGELERFASTRVRAGLTSSNRSTGNVICAVFRHDTSRALDPHLHSHCILFNATFDPSEHRWKALQNFEMLRARKYVENVYYHELARELRQLGYAVENSARGDFQIKGIARELCERFSKRHKEIDEKTAELLARKPHLNRGNLKDIREGIAQSQRLRKIKGIRLEALRGLWAGQVDSAEQKVLAGLKNSGRVQLQAGDAAAAVAWAEDHVFDRQSVVLEHEIWRYALEHARGQKITIADIQQAARKRSFIRDENNLHQVTTEEALQREWKIVRLAQEGIGHFNPLSASHAISNSSLDQDQRLAVTHILSSRDFVTLFRGAAGTGKSYALREVRTGLCASGRPIQVIAPQRQQVADLERDGLTGAQTLSEFLTRRQMPPQAVVIVDEAGQIGAKQMHELLHYVQGRGGRVILSGDTRQHGAVEASDALRAIEKYSGLKAAQLHEIRRQDPARAKTSQERIQIQTYRQAVKWASEGRLDASLRLLEQQGAIVTCFSSDQQDRLAEEYTGLAAQRHSVVVVSQTWSEIHKVNEHVRSALKSRGLIGQEDRTVTALETLDLTNAQKRDRRFYPKDAVVVLNRNAVGFHKGQACRLVDITRQGVVLEGGNAIRTIPFKFLDRLTVCRPRELALSPGDRLQLKANARTHQGQRLANGELVTVAKVLADGRIKLEDGRVLEKDYRQFVRGFAITSYASQGKTVDYVLFSDSAVKAATNQQQWYVTISRGRKGIKIFTSDGDQLRENILRSGDRSLAMDLAGGDTSQRPGLRRTRPFEAIRQRIEAGVIRRKGREVGQAPAVKISP